MHKVRFSARVGGRGERYVKNFQLSVQWEAKPCKIITVDGLNQSHIADLFIHLTQVVTEKY